MNSEDKLSSSRKDNNRVVNMLIVFAVTLAAIVFIPIMIKQVVDIKEEKTMDNLQNIYQYAETVEKIEGGLGEDVDADGVYIKLSEMSEIPVYNKTTSNKYSLIYNSTTGEYLVKYGDEISYPVDIDSEDVTEEALDANSLFTYSVTGAGVSIEGLTQEGHSALSSTRTLEIPKILGGETVVEVSTNAFNGEGFETIIIPSTVKRVGQGAFANNGIERDSSGDLSAPFSGTWVIEDKVWVNN